MHSSDAIKAKRQHNNKKRNPDQPIDTNTSAPGLKVIPEDVIKKLAIGVHDGRPAPFKVK